MNRSKSGPIIWHAMLPMPMIESDAEKGDGMGEERGFMKKLFWLARDVGLPNAADWLESLQAENKLQAQRIEELAQSLSAERRWAVELKAENVTLRATADLVERAGTAMHQKNGGIDSNLDHTLFEVTWADENEDCGRGFCATGTLREALEALGATE